MKGKVSRARLFGYLVAGLLFSFALFQANPASANWARAMSDTELDSVFAGSSILLSWKTQINFSTSTGFTFDFSASGTLSRTDGYDGSWSGEAFLLGGLFKIEAGDGDLSSGSGTVVSTESGPTSYTMSGVSFSVEKEGGSDPGNVQVSFLGGDTSGGQSVVTFNGANVDSNIGVNISVLKSSFAAHGLRNSIRSIVTRTVRRSLCLGCP